MSWNGTVRCSYCNQKGHNRSGCPILKENMEKRLEENPNDYYAKEYFEKKQRRTKRKCGYCQAPGHHRKTCPAAKIDRDGFIQRNQAAREKAFEWLKNQGIGVGTLIACETYWTGKVVGLVESVNWSAINARTLVDENGVGVPDVSCLNIAKLDGSKDRNAVANPRSAEVLGTIPTRLVAAQVPYDWLASKDKATLSDIDTELKESSKNYIRRYVLKTEDCPF